MIRRSFSFLYATLIIATALVSIPFAGDVTAQITELREGRTVSGALASGDTIRYSVEVGENYFLYGEVDQITVDVIVRLLDADGNQVGRYDTPSRGGERFTRRLGDAGIYTIEVIPFEDETGAYTITLHQVEPVESDPKKLTDQFMAPYDEDDSPGAAVQVWRNGRTLYSKAYGMANLAYGIPFETDTRTNIGSTSKQFTAFAIMLQADRGLLSLDDDIRKHIPELPEFEETITIRHLITHTSGLREFLNLLSMTGRRLDHGDWIDRSEIIDIVQRQPALQNSPGAEWNYNNTAFGLAAVIVERTSGQDFHVFMQENVFGPIGMTRTMVRPSPEHIVPDMSEGYTQGADGFLQIGDLGGAVGAGGIYSTVEDLQTWIENYADPRVGNSGIFDQMMTSFVLSNGDETGYGFGLSVDSQAGLRRVHHGGADVAHRSMLVYYPEINAGITTQSNHAGFNSNVAFELAEAFFADAMESEDEEEAGAAEPAAEEFDPETWDPEKFDEFVGRYALDAAPDFILTFTREGDTFYTQATGQQRLEIVPISETSFKLLTVEASVDFHRNDQGEVDGLTLYQNGENHATRLADDSSAGWKPSVEDLADFKGRYFSEELETFYTIEVKEERLVVFHRRLDDATLTAGVEDTFSGGGLTFSFERDRNGQVIGFYVANGRTRDVRFERVR
ncbi:serine hydrolase domain-containing protein [Gemmatimonadota bacterium]